MNDATALRATWAGERSGVDDVLEVVGGATRRTLLQPVYWPTEPVVGILTGDADAAEVAAAAADVLAVGAWQPTMASTVECRVSIAAAGDDLVTHLPLGAAGAEPTAPDAHRRLSALLEGLARETTRPEAALRFSARTFGEVTGGAPVRLVVRLEALGDRSVTVFVDPAAIALRSADGAGLWSADPAGPVSVMAPDGSLLASDDEPLTLSPGAAGSVALSGLLEGDPAVLAGAVLRCEVQVDLKARGPLSYGATRTAVAVAPLAGPAG